jgi:hypothetical protein
MDRREVSEQRISADAEFILMLLGIILLEDEK